MKRTACAPPPLWCKRKRAIICEHSHHFTDAHGISLIWCALLFQGFRCSETEHKAPIERRRERTAPHTESEKAHLRCFFALMRLHARAKRTITACKDRTNIWDTETFFWESLLITPKNGYLEHTQADRTERKRTLWDFERRKRTF